MSAGEVEVFFLFVCIEKTRTSLVGQRAFCVTWVSCASLSPTLLSVYSLRHWINQFL